MNRGRRRTAGLAGRGNATRCTTRLLRGDTAYGSWRDGGLTLLDVKDRTQPKLISHRNWSPPFGGGTHTALPLPDRDLLVVLDEAVLDNRGRRREADLAV